jgi:hypothetical protein
VASWPRLRNPLPASTAKALAFLALVVRRRYKQNECVVPYPNGLSSSKSELSAGHEKAVVIIEKTAPQILEKLIVFIFIHREFS